MSGPSHPQDESDARVDRLEGLEMAYGADGVAKIDGKVVFVPGLLPKMQAKVEIFDEKSSYMRGRIQQVWVPGPHYREPECSLQDQCGGCPWMPLEGREAAAQKQSLLKHFLRHIPVQTFTWVAPDQASRLAYRHRLHLQARYRNRLELGFFAGRSRRLVEADRCPVFSPGGNKLFGAVRRQADLLKGDPGLRSLELVMDRDDRRGMVLLHPATSHPPRPLADFVEALSGEEVVAGAGWNSTGQPFWKGERGLVAHGLDPRKPGDPEAGGLWVSPGAFTQVNPAMNRLLVRTVLDLAGDLEGQSVLDLYCGVGNLSLPLAAKGARVTGVEVHKGAIKDARKNARSWGLTAQMTWQVGDCDDFHESHDWDLVVLDPPRSGALKSINHLARLQPGRILYVSCSPPTLARDLKVLVEAGYKAEKVVGLDMFPQTSHIETAVLMSRT